MRILATMALCGIAFAPLAGAAEAKTQGVFNRDTEQKIKTEILKIEKLNKENDSQEKSQDSNVKSFNDNFIAPVYIAETSPKVKLASFSQKGNSASTANLPNGDFAINASAYTAAADECGKSDGVTASGKKVAQGRTLACPPGYTFGTKIEIDGMGTYTCEDRGGAIKGNHFDIYMQTKKEAFAFGRRNLIARVVK